MKKYLIYLMMATAVVMFGACSPDEDHEPETRESKLLKRPMMGRTTLPKIPTSRKILKNRAIIPILRTATARFWLPISVGAAQPNVWHRKSFVRQEQTSSALSQQYLILPTTPNARRWLRKKRIITPVPPSPMKWRTGNNMILCSSVAPYGGGRLR